MIELLILFFQVPPFKGRDLGWGVVWSLLIPLFSNVDAASSEA
jgi:hypothetical protein